MVTNEIMLVMGSQSDWATMSHAAAILEQFALQFDTKIISAHRTPLRMVEFATTAQQAGVKVIIAGAGGAAHLPGMLASLTTLPVLGVPVESKHLAGMDSLLSIVQMPPCSPSLSLLPATLNSPSSLRHTAPSKPPLSPRGLPNESAIRRHYRLYWRRPAC